MANHHDTGGQEGTVLSLILTFFLSLWTSYKMEVAHGLISLIFALGTCTAVFFLNRFLKKKFK
jgi:prolipoprotein diacylglyceryltransferase